MLVKSIGSSAKQFHISEAVLNYIGEQKRDYRLCTSCGGPVILPITIKKPKPNDIKVPVGNHMLYISATQARYVDIIDESMLMTYL
jgi:NAD(P)H-flavin reductase